MEEDQEEVASQVASSFHEEGQGPQEIEVEQGEAVSSPQQVCPSLSMQSSLDVTESNMSESEVSRGAVLPKPTEAMERALRKLKCPIEVDGEILGTLPASFEIIPKALKFRIV